MKISRTFHAREHFMFYSMQQYIRHVSRNGQDNVVVNFTQPEMINFIQCLTRHQDGRMDVQSSIPDVWLPPSLASQRDQTLLHVQSPLLPMY